MAANNVNVVVITGNLTKDPELRSTTGGTSVCEMRVAVNGRRKTSNGEWVDKPNFFDVVAFGAQGENCANYLEKGRPLAVEGRLDWREWEAKEGGGKRQAVQIIANSVQFLGYKPKSDDETAPEPASTDAPEEAWTPDPQPAGVGSGGEEDDIPF
jgi:single-strand DNA-binding protein